MLDWFNDLFITNSNFMPHGYCYLWLSSMLWLHIISDTIIAFSYFSIPFALWYFVHKRTDLAYRWVFILFGIFIILCGITHIMAIWIIWHPDYWLQGLIKSLTAITSLMTAALIWPLIPKLLQLPSPQALETSENYIRAIFNATPDAMLISNKQGIITMTNQQAEHLFGYSINKLIGTSVNKLLPKRCSNSDSKLWENFFKLDINKTVGLEHIITKALRKDGTEFDVEITLSPIQTKQGLFFASVFRDISEKISIDAALRLSEERFRRMANNSPVMIWMTNTKGIPTFVNQSWLDFTGLNLGQAEKYENWINSIHTEDRGTAFLDYYQNTDVHASITTEYRLQNTQGEFRWILDKGEPLHDENGIFTGYMGSAIDITDRKQIELNMRIAAIAFESQESMIITDANNTILRINKAFTSSTGYTEEDTIGQNINILKSGRHDKPFYTDMWNTILNTGAWQGEIWDRRKNGEIYPKWLSITAVKDKDNIVTHYVGTHTDITERKHADEQIKLLAFYDPLTMLPNRRLLLERLKHAMNIEQRNNTQLGLLMLDLDRFKVVNDTFGHIAGDELLQQVAKRITEKLRDVDTVARLGGDEFIILLENITQPKDAARIAKEIIEALNKPFCLAQSDHVQIGVSIGISLFPQHGNSPEELIDHADAALYQAKDAGRGCYTYFSKAITRAVQKRIALEIRLRNAIDLNELRVFFQPQIDIVSGDIIGAEALVRWQDPDNGLIQPSNFIPFAEETGLIIEIGTWVLRETCRFGKQWHDAGLPPLTLAVNVSAQQFHHGDFCTLVNTILLDTGFLSKHLELEITESGLMNNGIQDKTTMILNNLRQQGIRLAIDDFGTGYSSLAYLKHFPLDVLKIDKSFIDDIDCNKDDREIITTIISMGKILGFNVLAEGVETQAQLSFLQEKKCDSYQGYIKSKPLPHNEFFNLLHNQQEST